MHQSCIYSLAFNIAIVIALIDAGKMDVCTGLSEFQKIQFTGVKTTKIIDHRHHKFFWIICLEVEALKTLHSKGGRMCLRERIACKGFHLPPNFLCQGIRMP